MAQEERIPRLIKTESVIPLHELHGCYYTQHMTHVADINA